MNAKHTPGPWRTVKRFPRRITTHEGVMIGNAILANSGRSTFKSEDEAEANAAFIVRACNAHDDLVSALQSARAQLENYENVVSGESYNDTQINAALALAGAP